LHGAQLGDRASATSGYLMRVQKRTERNDVRQELRLVRSVDQRSSSDQRSLCVMSKKQFDS
jgi:hypothetical protein